MTRGHDQLCPNGGFFYSGVELEGQDLERRQLQIDDAVADSDLLTVALQQVAQEYVRCGERSP